LALVSSGDSKGALPHFALSTAANPGDAATLVQYGQALVVLGDNKAAITQLDRALAADPRSGTAHRLLGRAYRKLGNHKRFELEEARAVTLDPTDMAAQQLLAEALTESGHLEDALKRYAMMFASNAAVRSRADLWAAIGHIKDRQGKYDESVAYFGTAQQLDPTLPNIDKDLATAKAKLKVAAVTRPAMTRPSTAPSATLAVPTTGPATFGPAVPATAP
jgi:tetratricopeptide (TPR) repeat protein